MSGLARLAAEDHAGAIDDFTRALGLRPEPAMAVKTRCHRESIEDSSQAHIITHSRGWLHPPYATQARSEPAGSSILCAGVAT